MTDQQIKNNDLPPILVLGAGSWGTALALQLARNGNNVKLWGHDKQHIVAMQQAHENQRFLPSIKLPSTISLFHDLALALIDVQDVMMVVPSCAFTEVLTQVLQQAKQSLRIAWGTKGVDPSTSHFLDQIVSELAGATTPAAVLSGPSFAMDVAKQLPTAVSVASNNDLWLDDLIQRFHSKNFRIYSNQDLPGVQLCGVLKNIIAIAVGMSDGLGLGASCRAALITRSSAEIRRFLLRLSCDPATLFSLAGMGDLILTCTDNQSRNRRLGLSIGQGLSIADAKQQIGQEIEGMHNAVQIYQLAQSVDVDTPIIDSVFNVLHNKLPVRQAVDELLLRSQRAE